MLLNLNDNSVCMLDPHKANNKIPESWSGLNKKKKSCLEAVFHFICISGKEWEDFGSILALHTNSTRLETTGICNVLSSNQSKERAIPK